MDAERRCTRHSGGTREITARTQYKHARVVHACLRSLPIPDAFAVTPSAPPSGLSRIAGSDARSRADHVPLHFHALTRHALPWVSFMSASRPPQRVLPLGAPPLCRGGSVVSRRSPDSLCMSRWSSAESTVLALRRPDQRHPGGIIRRPDGPGLRDLREYRKLITDLPHQYHIQCCPKPVN